MAKEAGLHPQQLLTPRTQRRETAQRGKTRTGTKRRRILCARRRAGGAGTRTEHRGASRLDSRPRLVELGCRRRRRPRTKDTQASSGPTWPGLESAADRRYTYRSAPGSRSEVPGAPMGRMTLLQEVRRSLKTQQHAHLSIDLLIEKCVQRFDAVDRRLLRGSSDGGAKIDPVAPRKPTVYIGLPSCGRRT